MVRGRVKGILAMANGCPECEKIPMSDKVHKGMLCLSCQLEQAEWEMFRWMNTIEDIKQKIRLKEKQNELPSGKTS